MRVWTRAVGAVLFASLAMATGGARADALVGVAASARVHGPVLVFTERTASVSANGAPPFVDVSDDPHAPIAAGAIDADGAWALLRTPEGAPTFLELGGTSHATRRVPFDEAYEVVMRAGVVAVRAADGVHVSSDRGRTFRSVVVPEPCDGCGDTLGYGAQLAVTSAGTVIAADTEINTCGSSDRLEWMRVLRLAGDRFVQTSITVEPDDYAVSFHVGAGGWLYGMSYAHRLVAWGRGRATPIPSLFSEGPILVADNGRLTLAIIDRDLVELRGARARVLTNDVSMDVRDFAVDGRGRALLVTDRGLVRFSRVRGWETVLASP